MVIDVLYTIGPAECSAGGANRELRWSLRSLAKYGRNVGRVVVVGYPPDWLSDEVVRLPVERPAGLEKDAVIFHNVMAAIDAGAVSGRFLLSSDDHFLSAPFDMERTPLWQRKNNFIPTYAECRGGDGYRRVLDQTRRVLLASGYGIVKCNPHRNTLCDSRCAPELERLLATAPARNVGIEFNCAMGNVMHAVFGLPFERMHDWKVPAFDPRAVEAGAFSIRDRALADPKLLAWFAAEFGEPCRYEKRGGGLLPPWSVSGTAA